MELWSCVFVELWSWSCEYYICIFVSLCNVGCVELWSCGVVKLWNCVCVYLWSGGVVDV